MGGTCIQRAPVAALVPAWLRLQRSGGLFTVGMRQVNAVAKRWDAGQSQRRIVHARAMKRGLRMLRLMTPGLG